MWIEFGSWSGMLFFLVNYNIGHWANFGPTQRDLSLGENTSHQNKTYRPNVVLILVDAGPALKQHRVDVSCLSRGLLSYWTSHPSKQDTLTQCCRNVIPTSTTLAHYYNNLGPVCGVCWDVNIFLSTPKLFARLSDIDTWHPVMTRHWHDVGLMLSHHRRWSKKH